MAFDFVKYKARPIRIEAIQFFGWDTALPIMKAYSFVYYVGEGYGHHLRTDKEIDRVKHEVLDNAPEFLVVRRDDAKDLRVDKGTWIVRNSDNEFLTLDNIEFQEKYEKVGFPIGPPTNTFPSATTYPSQ